MLAQLVGQSNVCLQTNSGLTSPFNEFLTTSSLVVVEEFQPDNRKETIALLKSLITDTKVQINIKHGPMFTAQNCANFLFFSNDVAPVCLADEDRRFAVHQSKAEVKSASYYQNLIAWFESVGASRVLGFFLKRDLSAYNPKAPAPRNESHAQMVASSRSAQSALLYELYEAHQAPFANPLVVVLDVLDYINNGHNIKINVRHVEDFLREIHAVKLGQFRLLNNEGGRRPNFWLIRNHKDWHQTAPSSAEIRALYVPPGQQAICTSGSTEPHISPFAQNLRERGLISSVKERATKLIRPAQKEAASDMPQPIRRGGTSGRTNPERVDELDVTLGLAA